MTTRHVNHSGARWWKVDFHAHSPASFDFGASEGKPAGEATAFRDWLLAYMRGGIDALVIADHNEHSGIDRARAELDAMREAGVDGFREIALLAGVELTVDGGFHLLAVFDVETESEVVNGLLHVSGYDGQRGSSLATTKKSFTEVVDEIVGRGGLAVPAHADVAKGLYRHDARTVAALEASGKILAVEAVTEEGRSRSVKAGWVPVLGSDAHHLDGASCPEGVQPKFPGSHFTWVKMETPNLLGIRLALADGEQSVVPATQDAFDRNDVAHTVIERVVLADGDSEHEYVFGPWMNAVIGGRGVGKSTIIEVVRLAMGRFDDLPDELQRDGEWFSPAPPGRGASRFWSDDTRIEVHLTRLNERYRVVWSGERPDISVVEVLSEGSWIPQGGSPRDRFALLINSQKQIYETARDPQSLLRAIDDQPQVGFAAWREKFDELRGQYRTQRAEIQELQVKIDSENRLRGELSDVLVELQQLSKLRDSDEAKELDQLTQDEHEMLRWEQLASTFEGALAKLIGEFDELQSDASEVPSPTAWADEQKRRAQVSMAYESIVQARLALVTSREVWHTALQESPRRTRMEELREFLVPSASILDTPTVSSEEDAHAANARLLKEKNDREVSLDEIERAKTRLGQLEAGSDATLSQLTDHRRTLTTARQAMAKSLSGDELKLQVLEQSDDASLEEDLRRLVQKPTSFDPVFSETGLPAVLEHPYKPGRAQRISELKSLLKELRHDGANASSLTDALRATIDQRLYAHLRTLDDHRYQTEVALWFPEDRLRVQYKQADSDVFREIDEGSPGEKTAALLAVILQLSKDPLILDQPEDDLDNKLIYELVVTTLKRIKSDRQLIVVTHNANVVVNADAEHVTVLRHGKIPQVETRGSIQSSSVKQAICLIMEGGESAFQARYKRLIG
ncbi:TrlF family AAA-like ATPase [Microbacterium sp. MYb62]|uniref:TrlF family AAA-like ATPase n=1 Tax=Microbacterium sp. MYb62 TaxID=1848690 RepID=UPI0011B072EB|nr:AAA family ATPase [Microbacterium sp. MYb62]